MDSNSVILLINFILQVLQMLDHSIFKRVLKSSCLCGEIVLKNNDIENQTNQGGLNTNTNNKI